MLAIQVYDKKGREIRIPKSVMNQGLRLNDDFTLEVFQKGKRELKLNRTYYQFKSADDFKIDFQNCIYYLPTFMGEKFNCQLSLVNYESRVSNGRWMLESLNGNPFRINGTWCLESFIDRGDLVEIGFNKFLFKKPIQKNDEVSNLLAKSKIPILIEGETGTGKTRLAQLIHDQSEVCGKFVHLNLSAYSQGIVESELFGHVKGAFTGAIIDKKGAIQEARLGTLFLDEIDSLNLELQTKLLLFLESLEFRPVGSVSLSKADTRIIIASGKKLEHMIANNLMRKDFYYRISSGYKISLDSLRDHPERIKEFCNTFEFEHYVVISDQLKEFYKSLLWPGNIRQLKSHLIKKKILANGKKIVFDELDQKLFEERVLECEDTHSILPLKVIRYNYVLKSFNHLKNDFQATSRVLGISQNTVRSILNKKS